MESWTLTSGFLDSPFVTIQIADEHKQEGCNEVSQLTSVPVSFSNSCMLWAPTVAEELRNDVRFALRFKVGRKQQPLTDVERDMVAAAIVEHIRLCNWKVERGAPWGGFAELGRRDEK